MVPPGWYGRYVGTDGNLPVRHIISGNWRALR